MGGNVAIGVNATRCRRTPRDSGSARTAQARVSGAAPRRHGQKNTVGQLKNIHSSFCIRMGVPDHKSRQLAQSGHENPTAMRGASLCPLRPDAASGAGCAFGIRAYIPNEELHSSYQTLSHASSRRKSFSNAFGVAVNN